MSWVDTHIGLIIVVGMVVIISLILFLWRRPMKKWRRLRKKARRRIWLIADTHFDHANIIKLVRRPFPTVKAMNWAMVKNWNNAVGPNDTVYFVGDWAFRKKGVMAAKYWRRKLKGHVVSIRGNHDRGQKGIRFREFKVIKYQGYSFLLIHRPGLSDPGQTNKQKQKLKEWHGWIIHGHKHNNSKKYPFINGKLKTINVSVELTNYRPVNIDFLVSLNIDSIRRMETITSEPERW
jgi:calcineurin-like phosphoesterase family protein